MGLFRDVKNLFTYIKLVKRYKKDMLKDYNLNVDMIYRMWSVVNVPEEKMRNVVEHGYPHLEQEVKRYVNEVNNYLISTGIVELAALSRSEKLSDFSALLVFEYKKLNTRKIANTLLILGILVVLALIVCGIILIV